MKLNLLICAFLSLAACGRGPDIESLRDAPKLTAEALFAEFKSDPQTIEKYRGKILEVSGTVEKTGLDTGGHPYINLKARDEGGVQCFFLKRYEERAAALKPGDQATVRGKCTAYVINVLIEEAVLVQ